MPLSLFKREGTLRPSWRFTSDGVIWRLVPAGADRLVGESRNLERKDLSYFCIEVPSGKVLWKGATFGEQWWMGIAAADDETVFLHKYATPALPELKTIIAVDAGTGKELWRNADLAPEFVTRGIVVASLVSAVGATYCTLNARTGEMLGEVSEEEVRGLRMKVEDGNRPPITTSVPIPEGESPNAAMIRGHMNDERRVGPVEVLEHHGRLIFNYHEERTTTAEDNTKLNNILKILDTTNNEVLFEATVNSDASSVVPETFFVMQNMLVFIRDRMTLTAIDLASPRSA